MSFLRTALLSVPAFAALVLAGAADTIHGGVINPPESYIVDTVSDSAALNGCAPAVPDDCSFRGAIANSNTDDADSDISFNIPPGGIQTINVVGGFDAILQPLFIDATTQPGSCTVGFLPVPCIRVNGAAAILGAPGLGVIDTDVTIKGLALYNFLSPGISILGSSSATITGNFIGTADGATAAPNGIGIFIETGSKPNVVIGGGGTDLRNVISGNAGHGIQLDGTDVTVKGNLIGLTAGGDAALPNAGAGIHVGGNNNKVGVNEPNTANVVSGNTGAGIVVNGASNTLVKNWVGLNASFNAAVPNNVGIILNGNNNIVGGTESGTHNVIAGNAQETAFSPGVWVNGDGNTIVGNIIGISNLAFGPFVPNQVGVFVEATASGTTIGGPASQLSEAVAGNLISGNILHGIQVNSATGTAVIGNYIGTDFGGTGSRPNGLNGVMVSGSGTTIGGDTPDSRNIISGNTGAGVLVSGGEDVVISGNYIGLDVDGNAAIPNGTGIIVTNQSDTTMIGGAIEGRRNVISGNLESGVLLLSVTQGVTTISGNYIGTNAAGNAAIGNLVSGIHVAPDGAPNNVNVVGIQNNLISGNGEGIRITPGGDPGMPSHVGTNMSGNVIGLNAEGTATLPNNSEGIFMTSNFGGTVSASIGPANVVSGNVGDGIRLDGQNTGAFIYQNLIGTNMDGTQPLGNGEIGVALTDGVDNNTIAENVIAANAVGVSITGTGPADSFIYSNYIGTNQARAPGLGNMADGIIVVSADDVLIGGDLPAPAGGPPPAGNVIWNNGVAGVFLDGAQRVEISTNSIHNNNGLGIQNAGGANNNQQPPVLTSAVSAGGDTQLTGTVAGTPNGAHTVQFFAGPVCDSSGAGEGRDFLASATVTTDAAGVGVINETLGGSLGGQVITATATDPDNNTSEFSNCVTAGGSTPTPSPAPSGTPSPTPITSGTATPTPSPSPSGTPGPGQQVAWGDANCSGDADPVDSLLTLRHNAALSANTGDCPDFGTPVSIVASALTWGDADCSGTIDPIDSLKLLRFDAGLVVNQPGGCPTLGAEVTVAS